MISTPYKLDTVVLTSPSATFSAVQENNLQAQVENLSEGPAGHPSPMFAAVKMVKPMTGFKTPQIDTLAGAIPVWGVAPSATLYQKLSTGVAPAARASTTNRKLVLTSCIAYWSSITLPSRDVGTADVTLCSIFNGTDEPVIATSSVALAGTLSATNYFEAGPAWMTDDAGSPVTINETSIQSIQIDSGAQFRSDGDCASVYDTYGEISIRDCVVTIKTHSMRNVSALPLYGTKLTAFRFFARKFKNGGAFVADATAEHVKFSTTAALLVPVNVQASGQELYSDTYKIICLSPDGTTPPLVMTASQAIA